MLLSETLGSHRESCLHGIILFTAATARRPSLRHESRPYEAITSVTHQGLESPECSSEQRGSVQVHLKTVVVVVLVVVMIYGNAVAQM